MLVPPFAIGRTPVKLILPAALRAIFPLALTANVPEASGTVMVLAAEEVPLKRMLLVAVPPI